MGIFTFFKSCKWYQIVQSITYHKVKRSHKKIVLAYSNKSRSNAIVFVWKAHLHTDYLFLSLTDKVFYPILPQTLKHKILVQFEMHQKNVLKGSYDGAFCKKSKLHNHWLISQKTPFWGVFITHFEALQKWKKFGHSFSYSENNSLEIWQEWINKLRAWTVELRSQKDVFTLILLR